MRTENKTHIQNSIGRLIISALSFVVQIWWIFFLSNKLRGYSTSIVTISSIVAMIVAIWIFNRTNSTSEFKMPWIILLLAFPIAGVIIYILFGRKKASQSTRYKMESLHEEYAKYMSFDDELLKSLDQVDKGIANQFRYLSETEGYPVFRNTKVTYYSDAANAYDELIIAATQAKDFIFLEYHAIEFSIAFKRLYKVLHEKVNQGVDVRILYDDVGSIGFLNGGFAKKMQEQGISCKAFNRIGPAFRLYMNNRDHRKIAVIDGKVGFTGGYNLADEYFHVTEPYGFWCDTGIRLEGEAVKSLTGTFLEMWNTLEKNSTDASIFFKNNYSCPESGFVQPYADNPLDESIVGENVYMNMIKNAKETLYFTTPYLILSDSMIRELTMARDRGVDVRLVTPGIPDKKLIYRVTRSYYKQLLNHGVKIYEYSPGFLHAKQMVADNEIAAVGTINMDYRSFYHHFENAVLMYQTPAVKELGKEMNSYFEVSREVDANQNNNKFVLLRIIDCLLRLIAPLL